MLSSTWRSPALAPELATLERGLVAEGGGAAGRGGAPRVLGGAAGRCAVIGATLAVSTLAAAVSAALLRKFISDRGKIRARRVTGVSTQEQRKIARAVKNAREMALLPYSSTGR